MLTYVINTSENKTFDSDRLFDLAGYSKIRWMNCRLSDIGQCASEIFERQNTLGADSFRIAVLVDFFGFDRIRVPYGRNGYGAETGVDLSLYMPYIELFISDNLIAYLEKRELFASDFEVYYVQSGKYERYEFLDNEKEQLMRVLHGDESRAETVKKKVIDRITETVNGEVIVSEEEREIEVEAYSEYLLYCTKDVSLRIRISDYPYGVSDEKLDFDSFYYAMGRRIALRSQIRRHYYLTSYGGGPARAAFDTLSLSLYLIRMYEREESIGAEGDLEIDHLDAEVLKDVLVTSWIKVNMARGIAVGNRNTYYKIRQASIETPEMIKGRKGSPEALIKKERVNLSPKEKKTPNSADSLYKDIMRFSDNMSGEPMGKEREEFDAMLAAYLRKRDETRENSVEDEFEQLREMGALEMTDQCPSLDEYNFALSEKQKEISALFEDALAAEYISVGFEKEKEKAEAAYKEYNTARSCMNKNIIGDIIFMLLTVLVMFVPYQLLQLSDFAMLSINATTLRNMSLIIFSGLFIAAFFIQMLPMMSRMKKAKRRLKEYYLDCVAKRKYSFSALRRRYESDLIRIEEARYEMRQYKHVYEINMMMDANVKKHRDMLEEVQERLSSMLNNLDVVPVYNPYESVLGEFDITKSFRARENKVYRIFSVETIERMFPKKKGSDE